jgi:hypothetical protein
MSIINGTIGDYKHELTQGFSSNMNVRNIGGAVYNNRTGSRISVESRMPRVKYEKPLSRQIFENAKKHSYATDFAHDFIYEQRNLADIEPHKEAIENAFNN